MKWIRNQFDEDGLTPPPSSVDTTTSYELFSADCSDSDGVCASQRKRPKQEYFHQRSPVDAGMASTTKSSANTPLLDSQVKRNNSPPPPYSHTVYRSMDGAQSSSSGEDEGSEKKKQSSLVTIFSVWNTVMGSSLLTMAWGVERAGLGAALVLMPLMGGLCLYTAYVLLRVREHHGTASCEVPDLCRALLGRWVECVARGFSLLVMLGSNIVYWILMTNFLYYTVSYFTDLNNPTARNSSLLCPNAGNISSLLIQPTPRLGETPYWGLHTTVPVFVAFLIFPLLNFKEATFFTKFNSFGTLSVLYLVVFVMAKGLSWGVHVTSWSGEMRAGRDAAVLSGMLALSFYIHNIIITIMSQNRRQENNGRDLSISFALVTLTYVLVGTTFYVCFPLAKNCIEDNILNNFEMHDAMSAIARILLLFQVVTVYPLIAYMLRSQTLELVPAVYRHRTSSVLVLNALTVVVCVLFACFCPKIGTIVRYTGAVSGLVHIFTLPSMLQLRSLYLRRRLTIWKILLYSTITILGAVNLLAQFFISE